MTENKIRERKKTTEAKVTFEGLVMQALPNGKFRVRLVNDTIILAIFHERFSLGLYEY